MKLLKPVSTVFLLVAVSLAAGWLVQEKIAARPQALEIQQLSPDQLALVTAEQPILVSLSTCPACRHARTWLIENQIAFEERAIDASEAHYALAEALGIRGVPALIVGDRYLVGFDSAKMREIVDPGP